MDLFVLSLVVFLGFHGVSVFVPERVLVVISGIAAVVAAVIGITRL